MIDNKVWKNLFQTGESKESIFNSIGEPDSIAKNGNTYVCRYKGNNGGTLFFDTDWKLVNIKISEKQISPNVSEPVHSKLEKSVSISENNEDEKCTHCGFNNPLDAKFCGECGQPFNELLVCSKCGKEYDLDTKYCFEDGTRLVGQDEAENEISKNIPSVGKSPDPVTSTPEKIAEEELGFGWGKVMIVMDYIAGISIVLGLLVVTGLRTPAIVPALGLLWSLGAILVFFFIIARGLQLRKNWARLAVIISSFLGVIVCLLSIIYFNNGEVIVKGVFGIIVSSLWIRYFQRRKSMFS